MKREQIEKILRAAASLTRALGRANIQIVNSEDRSYVMLHAETEAAFLGYVQALGIEATRAEGGGTWWLRGTARLDGLTITVFSPSHEIAAPIELDEAAVEAALAQARDAIGGDK